MVSGNLNRTGLNKTNDQNRFHWNGGISTLELESNEGINHTGTWEQKLSRQWKPQ